MLYIIQDNAGIQALRKWNATEGTGTSFVILWEIVIFEVFEHLQKN
jgi:hypothetical protein